MTLGRGFKLNGTVGQISGQQQADESYCPKDAEF